MKLRRWLPALLAATVLAPVIPVTEARAATPCDGWTMKTLFSGLGILEYVLPDGKGGLLLSSSQNNALERITRDGTLTTFKANVNAPGAMVMRGNTLYVTTGDSAQSGLTNTADGTVMRVDMTTDQATTYASGLVMPNGMTFSAAGDAYISRDLGTSAQLVRVRQSDPAHPDQTWANLGDSNGVRVDPSQTWLYVSTTFNQPAEVDRVRLSNPADIEPVASLANTGNALPKGLDDMTADALGNLYIAANGSGEVLRLDPLTGASCQLASGLQNPSAVEFGSGPGWPADHLFVSGFDGTVRELTPPAATTSPQPTATNSPVAPTGGGRALPGTLRAAQPTAITLLVLGLLALPLGFGWWWRRRRHAA